MLDSSEFKRQAETVMGGFYFGLIFFRIHQLNETFKIGTNEVVTNLGADRVVAAHKNIKDEVDELLEAIDGGNVDPVALADCLGDIIVYALSEGERWGIPMPSVLHAILDAQVSKLEDGMPVMSEDKTKFIKGKHYVAPEPVIESILVKHGYNKATFNAIPCKHEDNNE